MHCHADDQASFMKVLEEAGDKLVVVDFTAAWCGPCKMIGPFVTELSKRSENKNVVFVVVDVDEATDVARKYNVTAMPTFIFIKGGEELKRFSGANKDKLEELVIKYRS